MDSLKPADVIIADFPDVTDVKRRPAVIISTVDYYTTVGDVILGAVTRFCCRTIRTPSTLRRGYPINL